MGSQRCPVPAIRYSGVEFPLEVWGLQGLPLISDVEDPALRGEVPRTPSGPEGSSGKWLASGAVGKPDRSWLSG